MLQAVGRKRVLATGDKINDDRREPMTTVAEKSFATRVEIGKRGRANARSGGSKRPGHMSCLTGLSR